MVFDAIDHDGGRQTGWMFCSGQPSAGGRVTDYSNHVGPFRMAVVTKGPSDDQWWVDWQSARPRDTFAWLADGTSNQFLIGEKHIPVSILDMCEGPLSPPGTINEELYSGDCSYLSLGVWGVNSVGRAFRTWGGELTLAKGPTDFTSTADRGFVPTHHYNFGSYHTSVVNFVMGDGSVQAVSVTAPHNILRSLAQVNDGKAVSLP